MLISDRLYEEHIERIKTWRVLPPSLGEEAGVSEMQLCGHFNERYDSLCLVSWVSDIKLCMLVGV